MMEISTFQRVKNDKHFDSITSKRSFIVGYKDCYLDGTMGNLRNIPVEMSPSLNDTKSSQIDLKWIPDHFLYPLVKIEAPKLLPNQAN